jgi:nucleotide-binding universal stress UspA family protein
MQRTFVTGYDGSSASRAALSHSLDRAGPDGLVVVVHACALPVEALSAGYYAPALDSVMAHGRELLDGLEQVDARVATQEVRTELVNADPASALTRMARALDADAIIVGTRGFGRARALLGSVAHELIHKAECPVTVIPERAVVRDRLRSNGPVLAHR